MYREYTSYIYGRSCLPAGYESCPILSHPPVSLYHEALASANTEKTYMGFLLLNSCPAEPRHTGLSP